MYLLLHKTMGLKREDYYRDQLFSSLWTNFIIINHCVAMCLILSVSDTFFRKQHLYFVNLPYFMDVCLRMDLAPS